MGWRRPRLRSNDFRGWKQGFIPILNLHGQRTGLMTMQTLTSIVVLLMVTATNLAAPPAPLPRKSPEFVINEPGGKTTMLSSFKGKVVVIEFLFLGSQHCL